MNLNKQLTTTLIAALLLFIPIIGQAQVFKRMTAHPDELPPAYVLVQLPTPQSRVVNYFKKKGDNTRVNELIQDVATVRQKMIADFNTHFHYCRFYYFIDTNADKIKDGVFAGNLLDSNLHPVANSSLPNVNDTTHFVLYFGQVQRNDTQWKTRKQDIMNSSYFVDGPEMIVAMDYKFHQLYDWLPYKARFGVASINRAEIRKLRFNSKHFDDIYYRPQAVYYSATLAIFYRHFK